MEVTRGRPRSFDRAEALDAATRLFWTRGYDAVSIADLTTELGISAPSLYAAFGDKRALFFESVDHFGMSYGVAFDPALPARDGIERLVRDAANTYADPANPPGCLVISGATNASPESADVAAELARRRTAALGVMARRLRRAVRDGELPVGTDAAGLAAFYAATVQGMSQRARDGASPRELRAIATVAMRAWPA